MMNQIVGICGTLLGTVLGWALNNLSQRGKISVFVKNVNEEFTKRDRYGWFNQCDIADAEHYIIKIAIDVYNSSRDTGIMRDIQLVFYKGKKQMLCGVPRDEASRHSGGPISRYDDLSVVNIQPKSVISIKMHYGLNNSDELWEELKASNKVIMRYKDAKNKQRECEIYNKD